MWKIFWIYKCCGHIFELFLYTYYFRNPNNSYNRRSERFVERNSMDSFPDSGLRSTPSTKEINSGNGRERKDSVRPTATPMYDIGAEIRPTPRWKLTSTVFSSSGLMLQNR